MKKYSPLDSSTMLMSTVSHYLDRNGPHSTLEISTYLGISTKETIDILSVMDTQKKVSWKSETGLYHSVRKNPIVKIKPKYCQ